VERWELMGTNGLEASEIVNDLVPLAARSKPCRCTRFVPRFVAPSGVGVRVDVSVGMPWRGLRQSTSVETSLYEATEV